MIRLFIYFLLIPSLFLGQENIFTLPKDSPSTLYENDLLSANFFANNRQKLRQLLPENSVAVFFTNPIRNRSNDVNYEYHQNPNFYYLTGLREPHGILLIFKDNQVFDDFETDEILFLQEKNKINERWTGKTCGVKNAETKLGLKKAMSNKLFSSFHLDMSSFNQVLLTHVPEDIRNTNYTYDLYHLIKIFQLKTNQLSNIDENSLNELMAQLREIKTSEEIELIKKAITITCEAQIELMKSVTPNMTEYQSEAIVEYVFKKNGAEHSGFPSILGSGENSCIIHYSKNRKQFTSKDLLIIDVGAEYHGYTADVARTIPVNGKFTEEEKIIYNIVLEAQKAGIAACKPGNKFWQPHIEATKVIIQKLMEINIISNEQDVQKYFMHSTSHYLGLDVHDAGLYGRLQPGNIITVEPGIYIPEGSDCNQKWWNIGIRIEDDILIIDDGYENLSEHLPKEIVDVELLMEQEGSFR